MQSEEIPDLQGIVEYVGVSKANVQSLVVASLKKRQVAMVADRLAARAWVVDDPAAPGQRIQWLAAICGGHVMSPDYIIKDVGSFLTYKRATVTRRWLWVSNDFVVAHPVLGAIILDAMRTGACKWVKLVTREAFLAKIKASIAKRPRTYYVIALVSEKEKKLDKDRVGEKQMAVFMPPHPTVQHLFLCRNFLQSHNFCPNACAPPYLQAFASRKCVFVARTFLRFASHVSGRSLGAAGL
jgi:hypothetical protein